MINILLCCHHESMAPLIARRELITILPILAVIVGWFINSYLNRKNEIAKKRLEYRLPTLRSFIDIVLAVQKNAAPFSDPAFLPLVEKVRVEFNLYGNTDEIDLFEGFIKAVESKEIEGANNALNQLTRLVRSRVRRELDIDD